MKTAPEVQGENAILSASDPERTAEVIGRARDVYNSLNIWRREIARSWYKRYALLNRDVEYPWPGASDVVLPMSDMHIGKLKPALMNAVFGGPRIVNCRPHSAAGFDNKGNIDLYLEAILRGGGPHAIPNFKAQMAYCLDSMLWSGLGIMKTFYEYEVVPRTETIRAGALPGMLGRLSIVPDITPAQRQAAMATYAWLNTPDILRWLGTDQPVQPMDRATFDQFAKVIKDEVVRLYGLDLDERLDKEACDQIMRFLRTGTREKSIDVVMSVVERDGPGCMSVSPFDFFVPWGTKIDLTGTDEVWHQMVFTKNELQRRGKAFKYDELETEKALEKGRYAGFSTTGTFNKPREYGSLITNEAMNNSNLVAVWDGYVREDIHGDGTASWVNYIVEPNSGALLRRSEFKVAHGKPPFVCFPLEHNSDDIFESRGIPRILRDAEAHGTALYRAIENNLILTTTPTFKARPTAFLDPEGAQIIPGEVIGVERMDDVQQFEMQSNTFPLERLLASFMPWPEQLVGSMDISAASNQRLLEPRTKYEVEKVAAFQMGVLGLRADLMLTHVGELASQLLILGRQYGPDSFFVSVVGEDPMRLSQNQIRGHVDVVPAGSAGDMDPNYRLNRTMSVLGMASQFEPLIASDPRYVPDRAQLFVDALNEFDPVLRQRYIKRRTPEELEAYMQAQQQMQERAQALADIAQRVEMNAGISKQEGALVLSEIAKRMPHKVLTEIRAEGEQARRDGEAAGVLARS